MQLISYRCPACAPLVSVPAHTSSRPLRAVGVTQQRACWLRCADACKSAGGREVWSLGLCCGRSHGKLTNRGRNTRERMLASSGIHKLMGWFLVVTVKELWQTQTHIKPLKDLVKVSITAIPVSDVRCAQRCCASLWESWCQHLKCFRLNSFPCLFSSSLCHLLHQWDWYQIVLSCLKSLSSFSLICEFTGTFACVSDRLCSC